MADRPPIPEETKRNVQIRARHLCSVCGEPPPHDFAHIIPYRMSQDNSEENLILLCVRCHRRSGKENWGRKTLRIYREHPFATLREADRDPQTDDRNVKSVAIRINLDLADFDDSRELHLRCGLAGFLGVSPESVRIEFATEGSTLVVVSLSRDAAQTLQAALDHGDPDLLQCLAPFNLHVGPRGATELTSEWPANLQSLSSTVWFDIVAARDRDSEQGQTAFEQIYLKYRNALLAFARQFSNSESDAEELVAGFVADKILDGKLLEVASAGRGRFRPFLKACFRYYIIDQFRRRKLAPDFDAQQLGRSEQKDSLDSERAFDLEWAQLLFRNAFDAVKSSCTSDEERAVLESLSPQPDGVPQTQQDIIANIERSRRFRLRKALQERLTVQIQAKVQETVADPADIDVEMNELLELVATYGVPAG